MKILLLAAGALSVTAAAQDSPEVQQIRSARAAFNDAIAAHDVPRLISYLDSEYQISTSTGGFSRDPENEARDWEEMISSRTDLIYVRTPETIEISESHPLAAEIGTWTGSWSTPEGAVVTGGRYAAQWRKVDGRWKVRSELFVALYCQGPACP